MALAGVGCGEPEWLSSDESAGRPAATPRRVTDEQGEAIRIVRESKAPEGEGRTEAWLEQRLRAIPGQVLFPHWTARRRGAARYEVRFTYTVLGDDQRIERAGLAWDVDLVLEAARGPRPLSEEELTPARARVPTPRGEDPRLE